jgi:hypothetical protein
MSIPFAQLVGQRAKQRTDQELTELAFSKFTRWALMSSDKMVSLDEVAWVGALLVKAVKSAGIDLLKNETRDENGARVVGVVASDGVKVADGAA